MNIKKAILLPLVLVLMGSTSVKAQTFSEWFRQKKTQKKYLIQQIVALQVYIGYARKGYKIAKEGLNVIGDLKNGEVNLHSDYFLSLSEVNPHVKEYTHLPGIIALQFQMVKEQHQILKQFRQSGAFSTEELDYIKRVFHRILTGASEVLDELMLVCTDGTLEMTDDARLERIDFLYKEMKEHYSFFKTFQEEGVSLALSGYKEANDVKGIEVWYNQSLKN